MKTVMKTRWAVVALVLTASVAQADPQTTAGVAAGTSPLSGSITEKQKIAKLLDVVERSGVTFIRNGSEHSAKQARQHLELKLRRAGSRIRTARHFIRYLATKSSWTGRLYYIRLKNGTKIPAGKWLLARLVEIERSHK